MKLRIVALGQRMPSWVVAGYEDYARRVPREYGLELVELKPAPRGRGQTLTKTLSAEATRIAIACQGFLTIVLDERGEAWSTRMLADRLEQWRGSGDSAAFVIGSADGLDAGVIASARARVSVSPMTLPHGLVRVLLVEQIYRAASLLVGHPYHRE